MVTMMTMLVPAGALPPGSSRIPEFRIFTVIAKKGRVFTSQVSRPGLTIVAILPKSTKTY